MVVVGGVVVVAVVTKAVVVRRCGEDLPRVFIFDCIRQARNS